MVYALWAKLDAIAHTDWPQTKRLGVDALRWMRNPPAGELLRGRMTVMAKDPVGEGKGIIIAQHDLLDEAGRLVFSCLTRGVLRAVTLTLAAAGGAISEGGPQRRRLTPLHHVVVPLPNGGGTLGLGVRGGRLGQGLALQGERHQAIPADQRQQVGVDLAERAVVAQLDDLLAGKRVQLLFGDAEIFGDLLGLAGRAVRVDRAAEVGDLGLEQVEVLEELDSKLIVRWRSLSKLLQNSMQPLVYSLGWPSASRRTTSSPFFSDEANSASRSMHSTICWLASSLAKTKG